MPSVPADRQVGDHLTLHSRAGADPWLQRRERRQVRTNRRAHRRRSRERMRRSRGRAHLEVGERVAADARVQFRVSRERRPVERCISAASVSIPSEIFDALSSVGSSMYRSPRSRAILQRPAPARVRAHVPRAADGDVGGKAIGKAGSPEERRKRQAAEATARIDRIAHPAKPVHVQARAVAVDPKRIEHDALASDLESRRRSERELRDARARRAHAQALDAAAPRRASGPLPASDAAQRRRRRSASPSLAANDSVCAAALPVSVSARVLGTAGGV